MLKRRVTRKAQRAKLKLQLPMMVNAFSAVPAGAGSRVCVRFLQTPIRGVDPDSAKLIDNELSIASAADARKFSTSNTTFLYLFQWAEHSFEVRWFNSGGQEYFFCGHGNVA